jgi:hypothetical protein
MNRSFLSIILMAIACLGGWNSRAEAQPSVADGAQDGYFEKLDRNRDGQIDPQEMPSFFRAQMERASVDISRPSAWAGSTECGN